MRILIVGPAHPLRGGIAALNERLAYALLAEDHEVEILSFHLQYPSILFPGTSQFTDDPIPNKLRITPKLNSVNPINWFSVGLEYQKKNYDMVIFRYWLPFMGPCLGTIAHLLVQNKKTKVLAITDNIIPHEKRIGDTIFTKYFLSACQGIVAMSKSVLEDFKQFEPTKPNLYCPHPLYDTYGKVIPKNEARKFLNLEENVKYILFFGFIRAYKGLDILLEALADERLKAQNVQLIIAGEYYEDPEKYEQIIQNYDLENSIIRRMQFIPEAEVKYYFCATDLITQPYKTATQSGVSQIAYHFNKPMLVTDVGGLAELIPHRKVGYVVPPKNAQEISEAIFDFYAHERENEFIENVKLEKQNYSWERMTKTLFELAEQV